MKEGDVTWGQSLTTQSTNAALTVLSAGAAVCVAFSGCEIVPIGTTAKLKAYQKKPRTVRHTSHRKAASQDTMYVSPAWLTEYHEMEAEHGGYSIADDQKIKHEGDKVKVPRTVLKHFHDLSKLTPPPPDD